jgi:dihydroflavonol-4-reductase
MTLLLTGATGFLGSRVLRLLVEKNYSVRALRRATSRMDLVSDVADRVTWVDADLTDIIALEDAMDGVTHVVHCGAVVSFDAKDARRMEQVNVDGTANLVNLALESGKVERFIHVSSIAALGRTIERPHMDESSHWVTSPRNSRYAISKYHAEQEVWRGQAEGLTTAIVNPSMIIGSGFWEEGTARLVKQVADGLRFYPTGGTGWVDVHDVAKFIVLLLESDIEEQRFVLSAENWSLQRYFSTVASELGIKGPTIKVRPWLAEIVWRIEWLRQKLTGSTPMVTRETARSSSYTYTFDNKKSLSVFGDQFSYTPIETAIKNMVADYKNHFAAKA